MKTSLLIANTRLNAVSKFASSLVAALAAIATTHEVQAQTTLSVGDIQVAGVTADANDSFTFVLWKDIAANTVIRFMDQSFTNGTTGVLGTEADMSLTFTSALTAGTVIRVEDTGTTLVNGGAFSGTKSGSLSGISASGDQVFVYQGTAMGSGTDFTGRTLLYGFNIADTNWVTSGTDSNNSFLPTAISGLDANIDTGNSDNADYAGARTGMTTAAYRAAVANLANFTQNDARFDLATGGFTSSGSVSLHWDANGTTAGNGGAGAWDATTQSRFKNGASGTTYLHWVNSATGNEHTAVFGGTAGTVSVASGGVTASGLQFDVSGYTIQSDTINLLGASPTLTVTTAGHTATVSSELAGSTGLTKAGAGTATISGANTYTGTTTVTAGTLLLGADNTLFTAASPGATRGVTLSGGTLDLAGNSVGTASGNRLGTLTLTANSTLKLTSGDSTQDIFFSDYDRTGGLLSITGWQGAAGASGTGGAIFFSTSAGFTSTELAQISFSGYAQGAQLIAFNGSFNELVAVPEPATIFGGLALVGLVGYRERRRFRPRW